MCHSRSSKQLAISIGGTFTVTLELTEEISMKVFFAVASLVASSLTAHAYSQEANWGQEVKSCNESNCYPDGGSRGDYVREQSRDAGTPGYGQEIHSLANPGKAEPKGKKL